jgi:hypothetical protein
VPHVLALTASIVTTKVKSLAEFIKEKTELEKILDSEVITTEDLASLLKFATQPNESVRKYKALPLLQEVSEKIYEGIERMDFLKTERIKKIELDSDLRGIPASQAIDDAKSQFKKFKRILVQTEKVLTGNETCSCPFVRYICALFWDDITIIK